MYYNIVNLQAREFLEKLLTFKKIIEKTLVSLNCEVNFYIQFDFFFTYRS